MNQDHLTRTSHFLNGPFLEQEKLTFRQDFKESLNCFFSAERICFAACSHS